MPSEPTFVAPRSLPAAVAELAHPDAVAVAGATSVTLLLKNGLVAPSHLVSLRHVPELGGIRQRCDGSILIGASTTLRELRGLSERLPTLAAAAAEVGNPRIRAVATVGGAVVHGDPRQDIPPALLVLGARLRITGPDGERTAMLAGFYRGFLDTALAAGEIVTALDVPEQQGWRSVYLRYCPDAVDDYPTVGVAAAVSPDGATARVAVAGAASTPLLVTAAPDAVAAICAERADPVDDHRGSADYKRVMTDVWVRRAVERARAVDAPRPRTYGLVSPMDQSGGGS